MKIESVYSFFNQFSKLLCRYKARELTQLFYRRCLIVDPAGILALQMHEELFPYLDTICLQLKKAQIVRIEFQIKQLSIHPAGLARCCIQWLGYTQEGQLIMNNDTYYEIVKLDNKLLINLVLDQEPLEIEFKASASV